MQVSRLVKEMEGGTHLPIRIDLNEMGEALLGIPDTAGESSMSMIV